MKKVVWKTVKKPISHVIFTDNYHNTCECGKRHTLGCYRQNEDEIWLSFCKECDTLFISREDKPTLWERIKQIWQ